MPAVTRTGDATTTGHGCSATTTVVGPSTDVFCNSKGVERKGDPAAAHTIPNSASPPVCVPHSWQLLMLGRVLLMLMANLLHE